MDLPHPLVCWVGVLKAGFVEFVLDFAAEGVEDELGAITVFHDADGEAFCAGADEDVIAGDGGGEDHFRGEELAEGVIGLGAFGEVFLEHGEADAEDVEARVDHAEAVEAFEEFWDGADAEGLGLLGDDECVNGGDDVAGDAEEAGGVIDQADVVAAGGGVSEECADAGEVGAGGAVSGFVIAGLAGGDEGKCLESGGDDEAL